MNFDLICASLRWLVIGRILQSRCVAHARFVSSGERAICAVALQRYYLSGRSVQSGIGLEWFFTKKTATITSDNLVVADLADTRFFLAIPKRLRTQVRRFVPQADDFD